MTNKYINIFVVLIFLSSIVIIPNLQYSLALDVSTKNEDISKNFYCNTEKQDEMQQLYQQIIDDLSVGINPNEKFCKLMEYREIRETIREISDNETLDVLESFFSGTPKLFKIVQLARYTKKIEIQNQSETFRKFKDELNIFIKQNCSSMENACVLPEMNISSIDIQQWEYEVEKYLDQHPKIQNILNLSAINPIFLVAIYVVLTIFWGLCYGAASCCTPHILSLGICFTEATIVSVGFGLITEKVYNSLYNSTQLFQQIIDIICMFLSISKDQVLTAIISLISVLVYSLFIWIWYICPFNILKIPLRAIGGGIMVIGVPIIITLSLLYL